MTLVWVLLRRLLVFLAAVLLVQAADVGFDLDGAIVSASATDTSFNTGGIISVNGWTVTVPRNLQIGFPAAWVPWREFVAAWQGGAFPGYEVSVVGNTLPGLGPVAAQIAISQFLTQDSTGFIEKINSDGSMKITNGPTIRINDPNSVYSIGYTGSPYMKADDENPSITSFSGFPMCVPRSANDDLCPATNRPNIGNTNRKQGTLTAPDPLVMAPFVVGDFIEYSGFKNSAGEIICYAIVATNIQIITGGSPIYIRMEDASIGVFTADANAEVATTRFVGYTSDAQGSLLTITAIDVDVCTGMETFRSVTTAVVDIAAGETRMKFDQRLKLSADSKVGREYRVATASTPKLTKNNITAGLYVQPVTEWIQPEQVNPGLAPLTHDFSSFNHLTQGLGRDENGNIWGPLDPFPQTGVNVFDVKSCLPASSATSVSSTTTASPTTIPIDRVAVTSATWTSSGGGTLAVICTSSNTNAAQIGMVMDYVDQKSGATLFNNAMTALAATSGTWIFSSVKIKQVTSVTCHSKLGGSAAVTVTARKRRSSDS
ncbi:hypothetical protein BJ170DRAFT_464411 [Xylariales sp. AK1849]|nr:hypothetical protein BJ170DRAFT_464411 [Xylariales sp. AK1849]